MTAAGATSARDTGIVRVDHRWDDDDQRPLDLGVVRRLAAFTKPYARKRNVLVVLVAIRATQFPALGWAIAAIISGPIAARDEHGTLVAVSWLMVLVVSTIVVLHFRVKLALELGEAVIHDLRDALLRHIVSLPLEFFHRQRLGQLVSRLTSDLEAVRIGVKDVAFVGIVQLGSMFVAGVIMAVYDRLLFLVVATLVPVLALVIRQFRRKLIRAYRRSQESFSRVTATVAESIGGIRVTQAYARAKVNERLFDSLIHDHARHNVDAGRRAAVFVPLLEFNGQVFLAILLVVGGYRALHHSIPFDVLVQFFFLSNFFFNPIAVLGNQYNQALTAMAGAERVFALLDTQPAWRDEQDAAALPVIQGRIEFRDVSFGYVAGRLALRDVSVVVEPGQTAAIVGPTGGGKSTLLALVAKFHVPSQGQILVDGNDLRRFTAHSLRKQMGNVLQNNFLFSGTVLDNVRFARPFATDEEVLDAARSLDVLDLIDAFPRGWETPLGERGSGLSLGQRQIVCFTRAMLAAPRLVLLDEATSAVDPRTEERLTAALARLLEGRTSLVVAHRLSTIRHADVVFVVEEGRIVERGSHDALLASSGAYEKLYRQFVA
jgi:ATP-binding cassette subfamily B protein